MSTEIVITKVYREESQTAEFVAMLWGNINERPCNIPDDATSWFVATLWDKVTNQPLMEKVGLTERDAVTEIFLALNQKTIDMMLAGATIKQPEMAYVVTGATEYDNGETVTREPRYFATRDRAVSYAQEITGANGIGETLFDGDWKPNPFREMIEDNVAEEEGIPAKLRVVARVEAVSIKAIEEAVGQ